MTKTRQLIAFDIEIAESLPDGVEHWLQHRPLGISCAATVASGEPAVLWYGKKSTGGDAGRAEAYFCVSSHNVDLFCKPVNPPVWLLWICVSFIVVFGISVGSYIVDFSLTPSKPPV